MVGPQQTTGLIGQKWKTGNGLELTGTNRPTQTTTPPTTPHTQRAWEYRRVSDTVRAKRPLYGPHPTQSTNHTHNIRMRVRVSAGSLITESQEH